MLIMFMDKACSCPILLRTRRKKKVPTDLFLNDRKYNWTTSSVCSPSRQVGLVPSFAENLHAQKVTVRARRERSGELSQVWRECLKLHREGNAYKES